MNEFTPTAWATDPESVAERVSGFIDPVTGGCGYTLSPGPLEGWDWVHCEVSGYALGFFTRLARRRRSRWRRSADGLARFLLRAQLPAGGFPHSTRRSEGFADRTDEVHAFDAGICAAALLDYAETVGCDEAERAAGRALDWLVACARGADGGTAHAGLAL